MKNFVRIIFLLVSIITFSQSNFNGKVIYQDVFKNSYGEYYTTYDLYFDNSNSLYLMMEDSIEIESETNNVFGGIIPQIDAEIPFYYRQLNGSNVIFNAKTALKQYTILDEGLDFHWEFYDETKMVGNYQCSKATTKFRGRHYTAWYTLDIPVDFGPRKFGGLPGLILEIYDDQNVYTAFAERIIIDNKEINFEKIQQKVDLNYDLNYDKFLDQRCIDAVQFKKVLESKMGRGSIRFDMPNVGSEENIEIDKTECTK